MPTQNVYSFTSRSTLVLLCDLGILVFSSSVDYLHPDCYSSLSLQALFQMPSAASGVTQVGDLDGDNCFMGTKAH